GGNSVFDVEVDRAGTLWVGLEGAGLDMRCARCSGFRHFTPEPGNPHALGSSTVSAVFESSTGELWVGLRPGGLARFDLTSKSFEHFRADPSQPGTLSSDSISVIEEGRDGTIWVGTQGGGLNRMVRGADGRVSFRAITRRDGLGADAIGGILEAGDGRLWISTTAGLSRYDPATGEIENFARRSGVQSSGYFIGAAAMLPDGQMVFGGLRGATIVDPARVPEAATPRQAAITAFRSIRTTAVPVQIVRAVSPVSGPTRVELPPELNDFTVEFSALSYIDPFAVGYEYRLDDYDAGWVRTDPTRRSATYTNLPPGHYEFRVRARINGGVPGPESRIAIAIAPAWWRTAWAWLAYLLGAAALLLAAGWQVRARLRERERARRRIRDSEERLSLALWGSGNELWDYDVRKGVVSYVHPLPSLAIERDERPITVEDLGPFLHPDDIGLFTSALMAQVKGESEHLDVTYRVRSRDGGWLWVRTRGRAVRRDANGRAERMVGTNDDVDMLKRQEESLARLNRELEQRVAERTADLSAVNEDLKQTIEQLELAQDQLVESEKMAALGGLVAGVAHEINTPLGIGVTAASHLEAETRRIAKRMAEGSATREELESYQQQAHEATEIILRNLRRADKLVKSFKQVAVDQSSEQKRQLDLGAYLEEVLTSLAPALKRGRHAIEVRCPEPVTVETYPGAIYQIVVNLVMNSVTHAFAGGEQGHIRIDVSRSGGEVEFDYRDDGGGMSEEVRRRAFEPFFTTRRGQGGSGLGLHIVYNLGTQVLRGRAQIESAPGQGFRFLLRFPA
ncbi:MAG TPA: ATP-binding protein, partial [Xanthomonadales bacterium]|nr:ATP-binding protein [Xanthomonadales bacterium]